MLRGAGIDVTRAEVNRAYGELTAYLQEIWRDDRDVPVEEHVRALLHAIDPRLPLRIDATLLAALVEAYARPALAVPPAVDYGARAALTALRGRGYTLALVSNVMRTPGRTLRRLLAHYGLLESFAHTTFSDEVGVRKPSPEIFALTLRAVGSDPATAVHVGDDPILDVQGAHAAGMRVIQVAASPRLRRPRGEGGRRADVVIPNLTALPGAVARLEAERS